MGKADAPCDVLVLGGGPAGCAAALHCARRGLNVTLLEAKPFPRDHAGETLHPGVEPVLRQLGVWESLLAEDFPQHEGNWIEWGAAPRFEAFGQDEHGPWRGFQAWRARFDHLLLDHARAAGVHIRQPCAATGVLFGENNRIAGVTTADGQLSARWVIDAAGGGHWLARQLRLAVEKFSPQLIARHGYVRGSYPSRDEAPLIKADATGWTWIARVGPDLYQWTRLVTVGPQPSRDWVPPELAELAREGTPRATDVTWRKVAPVAGLGYFMVGDAAATLDPAASHGVLKGLMSGMMAAHLIEAMHRGEPESRALPAYEQWLTDWFDTDVAKLRSLYAERWTAD